MSLTAERLRQVYDYCPESGTFTRLITTFGKGRYTTGWTDKRGYFYLRVDGRRHLAHRLAWLHCYGTWPEQEIDHINLDKGDNRIANLRLASRSMNNANRSVRAKSGFKGVVLTKYGWRAGITIDRKFVYLGMYETPEQAHAAYSGAAIQAYGQFARLN